MQPKNAHALNNAWKRQDTTKDLIVWFSGVMPNPAHAWTVRVADSKGYLGDYDATLQGNRFVIDTGQFADFPVGHYVLEIWETYSKDGKTETGIYPNPDSFVTFDINANVVGDDLVKAFDLDEVLGKAAARANKAIVVDGTETLPAGSQAAVESRYDGEQVHFTFKLPQGIQGIQGVAGKDGQSVWQNTTHRGPENTDCWFTDLVNASASNPPKINDIIIFADGNMAMITKVNITNDTSQGGGMFDYGPWVGNIKGPTGPQGVAGKDGHTPVRGTDYWTDADKQAIYSEMATMLNQFSAFKDYGIQKNGDFNKLIAPGTYNIQGSFDNRPIDNWGSLIVFSVDTRTVQFFVTDHGSTFVRTCDHAIFDNPWVKLGG